MRCVKASLFVGMNYRKGIDERFYNQIAHVCGGILNSVKIQKCRFDGSKLEFEAILQ